MAHVRKWLDRGPQSKDALELAALAGDHVAMLKLGDILMMCGYGVTNETRDPKRACRLYYEAAGVGPSGELDDSALPEAMVQVAMIIKAKLLGTQLQNNEQPLRPKHADDPLYEQMIYWLGKAAKLGYVAPITLHLGGIACRECGLAGSGVRGAEEIVAAISERELKLAAALRSKVQDARKQSVQQALACADDKKQEGNQAIKSGENAAAAAAYDSAISALGPFESETGVAWPLVLCLSNHAEAMVRLGRHAEALDSCNDAAVLLERYEASFNAEAATKIAAKIEVREKAAIEAAGEAVERAKEDAAIAAREARREEQSERARREADTATAQDLAREARRVAKEAARKQKQSEPAAQRHAAAERNALQAEANVEAAVLRAAQAKEAAEQAHAQRRAATARAEQQRAEERAAAIQQREARAARRRAARTERDAQRARDAQAPPVVEEGSTSWASQEFESRLRLEQQQEQARQEKFKQRNRDEQARAANKAAIEASAEGTRAEEGEQECCICLAGDEKAPLKDWCGHGHLLHDHCAREWRDACRKNRNDPHCPTCQRGWVMG